MINIQKDKQPKDIEVETIDNTDEIEMEEVENNSKIKIKQLQAKLKVCETEKMKHLDDLQRTKAEFLNAKKRLEEQKNTDIERATSKFAKNLLPLCDSFNMAMSNKEQWEKVDDSWRKGVESIYSQLSRILKDYEISTIDPKNEPFDPNLHEAMSAIDSNEYPPETVVEVLQLGYIRKNEIIRPAKVIITN
jgi:molecular chaperone GrpE